MNSAVRVLDSHCILAHFQDEPGSELVDEVYSSAQESGLPLLLTTVNWGEVFYATLRTYGRERAEQATQLLSRLPIDIVPADLELARQAAEFKATRKMSYSDCFAAALAKLRKAELVTGDKEFRQVEREVKILWI